MKKIISKDIYFCEVKQSMPRILNLLNRNPSSHSYGSFDRDYWNYNSFDISNSRKQEAVLTLALMYAIQRNDNPYYKHDLILKWINSALEFTKGLQNKDGSFNEMYPYEHSFVATSFVCYAVSETMLLLKDEVNKNYAIIACLKNAGDWIIDNDEKKALNQKAGAIIALYNVYLLTKELKYKEGAEKKLNEILSKQNKEGWFSEYGGPDIGYLSLTIDYLAKYYQKTKDKNLLSSLKKAVDFIRHFILPNHTFGGETGSRNTEYMIPHGFELLSKEFPDYRAISNFIRESIKEKATVSPTTVDDRYLLFNSYTYLQAYNDGGDYKSLSNKLFSKIFTKYFEDAGIIIKNDGRFYGIINLNKGGVSKIVFKNSSINDGGCIVKLKNGKNLSSIYLGKNESLDIAGNSIKVERKLMEIAKTSLTPFSFILFRVFQLTFGRNCHISRIARDFLRNKIIGQKSKKTGINFTRNFVFEDKNMKIIDEISPLADISSIIISSKLSFIFAESSRFFQISDLDSKPFLIDKKMIFDRLNANKIRLFREYNRKGILVKSNVS